MYALRCVATIGAMLISLSTLAVAFFATATQATAKSPGAKYCFYSTCHRVLTLAETRARVGTSSWVVSSYYDHCSKDAYNPCGLTSSGEPFLAGRDDNAASPIFPDGTILLVWNPVTQRSAIVRINNAGPYWGNRTLDVSKGVAKKLRFYGRGIARLKIEVLYAPTRTEARYRRNRRYKPVAGYLGEFASMKHARGMTVAEKALDALAGSALGTPVGAAIRAARSPSTQARWAKLRKRPKREMIAERFKLADQARAARRTRIATVSVAPEARALRPTPAAQMARAILTEQTERAVFAPRMTFAGLTQKAKRTPEPFARSTTLAPLKARAATSTVLAAVDVAPPRAAAEVALNSVATVVDGVAAASRQAPPLRLATSARLPLQRSDWASRNLDASDLNALIAREWIAETEAGVWQPVAFHNDDAQTRLPADTSWQNPGTIIGENPVPNPGAPSVPNTDAAVLSPMRPRAV